MGQYLGVHARAGVVYAQNQSEVFLTDADRDLTGQRSRRVAEGVECVVDQIAEDGDVQVGAQVGAERVHLGGRVEFELDAELGCMAHLADEQGSDRRVGNALGDKADGLGTGLGDVQHIFLGLVGFAQFEQTQDDVQFVHKVVHVGAHGLDDVAYTGQVFGQTGDLGAVAEDSDCALDDVSAA